MFGIQDIETFLKREYQAMKKYGNDNARNEVAPFSAVATVPGELVSSAVYEALCGVMWLSGRIGDAARNLRGR